MKRTLLLAVVLSCSSPVTAQRSDVQRYVRQHQAEIVREFTDLLAIPNVRTDVPNIKRNAEFLRQMLERRGMNPEVWDTPSTPVVFGERLVPGIARTLLFYIHYDGQPVEKANWRQPDPFTPIMRDGTLEDGAKEITDFRSRTSFPDDWRLYARSAGDDKGPIQAFVSALDAIGQPAQNIKVILHGEEEGGGPALDAAVKVHGDRLRADAVVILDGPQHASGKPTLFYGARGGAGLTVTVYTATSAMHSGNYGNWLPDANVRLAQLLASMVDASGKVAISGFYDDVLRFQPDVLAIMRAVPDDTAAMQKRYGVGSTDGVASTLQEGLNLPSFSVRTMTGGEVGGVIPARAMAEIALRLVKENSGTTMVDRVTAHIRKQGYFIVGEEPDAATLAAHPRVAKVSGVRTVGAGGGAWRTEFDVPAVRFVSDALARQYGSEVVRLRTLGGGVPANAFIDALHMPVIGLSLANYDDNQHTDNENLRLGNLWEGIETIAAVMTAK